jgi:hypothetical protein
MLNDGLSWLNIPVACTNPLESGRLSPHYSWHIVNQGMTIFGD